MNSDIFHVFWAIVIVESVGLSQPPRSCDNLHCFFMLELNENCSCSSGMTSLSLHFTVVSPCMILKIIVDGTKLVVHRYIKRKKKFKDYVRGLSLK